ncbi:hypothetical protein BB558_000954 [Smittium angustum]|uniref:Formyl transferase C-terminal domain-containing protein n=1 Tax=Smittium angustum TaxID=133377 RepID=A0A2U1JCT4_SMIAN|nr:hypothetical protein BB558_000954 [Smittium angustum]
MNNDKVGGVTIQELHPKVMDAGKIINQKIMDIPQDIYRADLEKIFGDVGGNILIETLKNYSELKEKAYCQDESKVSYAPKLDKNISVIDWNKDTAADIYSKFRAFGDKNNSKILSIHFYDIFNPEKLNRDEHKEFKGANPGTILFNWKSSNSIGIVCSHDTIINIKKVRVEGKSTVSAYDFVNGYSITQGQMLI